MVYTQISLLHVPTVFTPDLICSCFSFTSPVSENKQTHSNTLFLISFIAMSNQYSLPNKMYNGHIYRLIGIILL